MTVAFNARPRAFQRRRDVRALGEEYLDTLGNGDLLQNDEQNPVVYAREGSASLAE
jgi:hypothetical protein